MRVCKVCANNLSREKYKINPIIMHAITSGPMIQWFIGLSCKKMLNIKCRVSSLFWQPIKFAFTKTILSYTFHHKKSSSFAVLLFEITSVTLFLMYFKILNKLFMNFIFSHCCPEFVPSTFYYRLFYDKSHPFLS